jgi:hypothetical protein
VEIPKSLEGINIKEDSIKSNLENVSKIIEKPKITFSIGRDM